MAQASNPYQKMSASGLDSGQLLLMRLLLQQNHQPPQLKIAPVQNIGQGIAEGVGNIANAIGQRRFYADQARSLDQMIANEQQQSSMAEQARQEAAMQTLKLRAEALVNQYHVAPEQAAAIAQQPDAVYNKFVEGYQQQESDQRKPGVEGQVAGAKVLGEGTGKVQLNQQAGAGKWDLNTPNGQNMFRLINGFDPQNTYTGVKQQSESDTSDVNNQLLRRQFPALVQKPLLENQKTQGDITNQNIINQNLPAQQAANLTSTNNANAIQGQQIQRDQVKQDILHKWQLGPQNGGYSQQQAVQALIMNGNDPVEELTKISNSKNNNAWGFNKPEGLAAPQAPKPQAPQGAPTTLLNFQPAGQTLQQYASMAPQQQQQQAGQFRQQLGQNVGEAFQPAARALQGAGTGIYNFENTGANLLGLPQFMHPQAPPWLR